ncbi:MAG: VOC family protein [Myxococcota bacterium]|nr:VOC family protein [Myxococcales bacterium]
MSEEPVVRLGPISHVGIAVEDCEKAAAWWERVLGVGPFTTSEYVLDAASHFELDGVPAKARMKAAIAYSGKVFVELVEVLEGESPHTRFLRAHGEGLQHVAFAVEDIQRVVADLAKEGLRPILQYQFEHAPKEDPKRRRYRVQEVYLNTADVPGAGGTTVQLIEITPL